MENKIADIAAQEWRVEPLEKPMRLDRWLAGRLSSQSGISRNLVIRFIREGWVTVQKEKEPAPIWVKNPDCDLKGGEIVGLLPPKTPAYPDVFPKEKEPERLYEDKDMVAIHKPAGLLTHPVSALAFKLSPQTSRRLKSGVLPTVLAWIQNHYPESEKLPRFGIVHRLDAATSGVLVIAKTLKAYRKMLSLFEKRRVKKTYVALVHGQTPEGGEIRLSIAKRYTSRGVRLQAKEGQGREAETFYRTLRYYPQAQISLVELQPTTGRTHQLRLHLAAIGHPICGDPLYGRRLKNPPPATCNLQPATYSRLMLHALSVEFKHPVSGKLLTIKTPPPADFIQRLQRHVLK